MEKYQPDPKVYNPQNEYGASQREPNLLSKSNPEEYRQLCAIVKNHFPDMSQEQIDELLKRLRSEGCGYVAMVNSLFEAFIHNPSLFREKFGFPMYSSDGTLNYNQVLVDLYCKTDNHNGGRFLFFTWDIFKENEDVIWEFDESERRLKPTSKPHGNNELQMQYRWESYCKEYGIDVKVDINRFITPENFEKYAKKGSVSILCSDFKLYNASGKETHVKNGHYMTITGAESGKYIVSSWGDRYTLNPKDIKGFKYYQVIRYSKQTFE